MHLQIADRGNLHELSLRPEDTQAVRQITTEFMEGCRLDLPHHPRKQTSFPMQNTYCNDLPKKQQAMHNMGYVANQVALSVDASGASCMPPSAHGSFYPLPASSDQGSRLPHTTMFDGSGGTHEGVYFPPPVLPSKGVQAAAAPASLSATHIGNNGRPSLQAYNPPQAWYPPHSRHQVEVAVSASSGWNSVLPNGRLPDVPPQVSHLLIYYQPILSKSLWCYR